VLFLHELDCCRPLKSWNNLCRSLERARHIESMKNMSNLLKTNFSLVALLTVLSAALSGARAAELESGKSASGATPAIVPQTSKNAAGFVPKHWFLESSAEGDLNKDGLTDCALIISDTEDSSESKPAGQRKLVVALRESDGLLHKSVECETAVSLSGNPPQVAVKKDVLSVEHDGGFRYKLSTSHKYQLHNDRWDLIGYTHVEHDTAATHAVDSVDVNLLTGEVAANLSAKRSCSSRFFEVRSPQIDGIEPSPADWTAPSVWLNARSEQCPTVAVQSVHSKDTLFLRTQLQGSNAISEEEVRLLDEKGQTVAPRSKRKTAYGYILSSYDLKPLVGEKPVTAKNDGQEILRLSVQVTPEHCGCKKTFSTAQNGAGAILLTKMKGLPAIAEVDMRDGGEVHPVIWPLPEEE
jgi:hypothetical protein